MASFSRRSFLHLSAAATAGAVFCVATEPMLAAAARGTVSAGAVVIDENENPLGPSQAARDAIAKIIPLGGRYFDNLTDELIQTFATAEGLKADQIQAFPGSTPALYYSVRAYCSAAKSYVTADPGYEAGMFAAATAKARVIKVPLTKTYAHDVKGMLAAGPDAGIFYVCTPNNPTGTLTSHADIEYLADNKPKDSIVLIDEAYIHFSGGNSALDLVKAGKDVIVLRTFSKIYGMAGLRCGFAVARPDLLNTILEWGGGNFMPTTAVVAAVASLKDAQLVAGRRSINTAIRQHTFQWLDRNGYSYIPSESNCFLLDTKRPGKIVRDLMAKENVLVGRVWPVMPTCVRVTIGTQEEMEQFQTAFHRVMTGAVSS